MNIYKATINALQEGERTVLEGLGIIVGDWDKTKGAFLECILDDQSLKSLDPFWGRFIWDLTLFKVIRTRRGKRTN